MFHPPTTTGLKLKKVQGLPGSADPVEDALIGISQWEQFKRCPGRRAKTTSAGIIEQLVKFTSQRHRAAQSA